MGRTDDNDIVVPSRSLSRAHATVSLKQGRWVVIDRTSKNGTFVNERRVEERVLDGGDILRFGEVAFRFEDAPVVPTMVREVERSFGSVELHDLIETSSTGQVIRLREAASRDQAKLAVLLRVSELLSSPGDLDSLLERTLDLLFRILDVDRVTIGMVDETTDQLKPRVTRAVRGDAKSLVWSETIVAYVAERQMSALFADAPHDARVGSADSIHLESISASMCAPLRAHGKFLGVLYVDRRGGGVAWEQEDLEFLGAFANQAAIAVENAALYRRLEAEAVERNAMARFFPPSAFPRLGTLASLVPMDADVTAMFCDLSDYTALSARLPPRDVLALLNAYFPRVAEIVFRHEGTLEKYIGDALLAVWGAPFPHDDDADRAVTVALAMRSAAAAVRTPATPNGLRVHIGIHSGIATAGNIGSNRYLQYATIGEATNIASRVTGLAGPGDVLLSEETRVRLRRVWNLVPLAPTRVKGREEPLQLYRVDDQVPEDV